jgi:hypothetical protein
MHLFCDFKRPMGSDLTVTLKYQDKSLKTACFQRLKYSFLNRTHFLISTSGYSLARFPESFEDLEKRVGPAQFRRLRWICLSS